MTEPIHIISLGAGVQSSTMALMAAVGEITPMPVAAIFADTQAEPRHVYAWLDYLIDKLPFPVRRVSKGNLLTDTLSERENGEFLRIDIPAYVFTNGVADGFINRSCTRDYKIKPIISEARSMVGGASMLQWRRAHKASLELLSEYKKEEKRARKEKRKAPPISIRRLDRLPVRSARRSMDWDLPGRNFEMQGKPRAVDQKHLAFNRQAHEPPQLLKVDGIARVSRTAQKQLHVLPISFKRPMEGARP